MADTIEEQNKLMSEWGKTMAEMRKKTKEISAETDSARITELENEKKELNKRAKRAKGLNKLLQDNDREIEAATKKQAEERTRMLRAQFVADEKLKELQDKVRQAATDDERTTAEEQIRSLEAQKTIFKQRQAEIDDTINNPKGPLRSLFSNMNKGLTGGLKSMSSDLGQMFSTTGLGKTLNMGAKLLGKDGIRSMFEDPSVQAMRKKTEEEEREQKLKGLTESQKEELERKEELSTAGKLTEGLFGGVGKLFGLDTAGTRESDIATNSAEEWSEELSEGNEILDSIENSLRGSPPYLMTISETLIEMAKDLRTVTQSITGQIDDSDTGRKEREFEAQKRHDELVEAQSEGGALGTASPEVEIKGGGFLEKLGSNAGKGLKGIVDGIFSAIKAFIDGIGSIINAALNIIKNFVNKVGQIIQKLAKIITRTFITLMKGLGKGISALFKALGSIPPQAIGIAAAALGVLTVSMIGMAFAMRLLAPLMESVAPVIIALVNGIVKVVKTLANLILEGIKTVVGGIIELSKIPFTHFARLAGGLLTLTPALFALGITGLIAGPGIAMVAGGLLLLGTALNIVAPAIQKIVPPLLALFEGLNRVMGSFLTTIVTAVEGIGQVIGSLITTFGSFITTFAEAMIRLGEADLFKIALGFMALAPALGFFGLMTTLAIPALLALGIAAGGLASLMSQDPERLSQMAEGFKILGGAIKGFAKSAYGLLPAVGILTALSAIPFAGKLIDLAIAKTESLNVTTGARENIISASNTNAELRDELVTTSSINQVNAISSSNIVNTSQNMFIKPQVRDIGLMSSRGQTTVHSIA